MLTVDWKGGMAFQATSEDGTSFTMDASPDHGGQGLGPSPMEAFVAAAAGCSAMDVVSILKKMQQKVTSYRIEVEWSRTEPGKYPRPVDKLTLCHVVQGEDLDPAAVARAVELTDSKYCGVIATLRSEPEVKSIFRIEE